MIKSIKQHFSIQNNHPQKNQSAFQNQQLPSVTTIQHQTINQITNDKIPQSSHTEYRLDIDGLRTIAITIVVIFHAYPQLLTGGFIGVDVFFVISGYLISGIIIKQTLNKKFSFIDFYSRRIKRIYPALIVVLMFCLFMLSKVYDSYKQYIMVTKTMTASTLFSANLQIMIYKKQYFDPSEKQNAFLHLWSLGVQEQFYIIWPCLITILLTRFRSISTSMLILFTMISFALGIMVIYDHPKTAFYFPLCRFWQMSIGGVIAYKKIEIKNFMINNILSILGTLAILIATCIINEKSLFPGWWALIPTLSSACILQAGPSAFVNKYILSTKLFVFIGKISYPLYLWHWPLLVFSRKLYPLGSKSIFGSILFIVFLSVVLSIITYYLIENQLRFRKSKKVVVGLVLAMLIIGITGASIIYQQKKQISIDEQIDIDLPILGTDSQQVKFIKEFRRALVPRQDDYYEKNGRKIPNSSKNKNRQPTSVQKIKMTQKYAQVFGASSQGRVRLQKKVTPQSKYWIDWIPQQLGSHQVTNEGKQNDIIIIGDSHASLLQVRFQHLYEQSVKKGEQHKFPTVVALCHSDHQYISKHRKITQFFHSYLKHFKPKRFISMNSWLTQWIQCHNGCPREGAMSPQHIDIIKYDIDEYANYMKQLVDIGIQVYVGSLHFNDDRLQPSGLYDNNGLIQQNLAPLKLSEFRLKYSQLINYFDSALIKNGIKMIDMADNFCCDDICYKLTPSGHAIYQDSNHWGVLYARYWGGFVDHIADF